MHLIYRSIISPILPLTVYLCWKYQLSLCSPLLKQSGEAIWGRLSGRLLNESGSSIHIIETGAFSLPAPLRVQTRGLGKLLLAVPCNRFIMPMRPRCSLLDQGKQSKDIRIAVFGHHGLSFKISRFVVIWPCMILRIGHTMFCKVWGVFSIS